jgi:hypothetical protein
MDRSSLSLEHQEIYDSTKNLPIVSENHDYFNQIIEEFGYTREVGLSKLVDLVALSSEWDNISSNIREWIRTKKIDLNIQQ